MFALDLSFMAQAESLDVLSKETKSSLPCVLSVLMVNP